MAARSKALRIRSGKQTRMQAPLSWGLQPRRLPAFLQWVTVFETSLAQRAIACLVLFGISAGLILPNLGYPRRIIFDETYFIPMAQRYINGVFFLESHPPLAWLLIAAGQKWMHPQAASNDFVSVDKVDKDWPQDEDITGYRIMPALFGVMNPLLVFMTLLLLFERSLYAFAISAFVALDNALIIQARAALLDSILVFFSLATIPVFVYLMRRDKRSTRALVAYSVLWGVLAGGAASVKLTGLFVLALAGVYGLKLLLSRRWQRATAFAASFAVAFAITWLSVWAIHFSIASHLGKNDYGISDAGRKILTGEYTPDPLTRFAIQLQDGVNHIKQYEAGVPKLDWAKPDEIGSPWYMWPVGGRAINYRWETLDGQSYRYSYLVGNPVTWLVSLVGVVLGTALVLADLLFRFIPAGQRRWLYSFVLLYWAYMIPIMFIPRVMYLYHYLPPLIVGLVLFAIVLRQVKTLSASTKRDILVVAATMLVVAFLVFKPLTYYEPLTREQFQQRNVWAAWDLKCIGCK